MFHPDLQRKNQAQQTAGDTAAAESLAVSGDADLTAAKLDLLHTPPVTGQAAPDEQPEGPRSGQTDAQPDAAVAKEAQHKADDRPTQPPEHTTLDQHRGTGGAISTDEAAVSAGENPPASGRLGADRDEADNGVSGPPSSQGITQASPSKPLVLKQGVAALNARESFKAALAAASLAEAAGAAGSTGRRTPRSRNGNGNATPRCGNSWARAMQPLYAFARGLWKPAHTLFLELGWPGRLPVLVQTLTCGTISI